MEINAALSGIAQTLQLFKLAVDARDHAKATEAHAAMLGKLVDAYTSAASLAEDLDVTRRALRLSQDETDALKVKLEERERYAVAEVRPGAHAYASQPVEGREQEPRHYLCQACHGVGTKSILRVLKPGGALLCIVNPQHSITQWSQG